MSLLKDLQDGLKKEFLRRKNANPKYSLRAYAKCLNISVSRLSQIMNDKRSPSKKQIEKISTFLGASTKLQFVGADYYDNKRTFDENQFKFISNWIFLSILSILKEKKEVKISELVRIFKKTDSEINSVLNILSELKLLRKHNGMIYWMSIPEKTTDQVSSEAIKEFHKSVIDEAKSKIESVPVSERDFSSVVMFTDAKKLEVAKEEIKNFRRKLTTLLEDGSKNQVYALNIQLFPLSERIT